MTKLFDVPIKIENANFSLQNTIWNRIRRFYMSLFRKNNGWYYGTLTKSKYENDIIPFFNLACQYATKKYGFEIGIKLRTWDELLNPDYNSPDSIGYCQYIEKDKIYYMWINPKFQFNKKYPLDDLICHELAHAIDKLANEIRVREGKPLLTHGIQYQDILEDLYKEFRIPIAYCYKDEFILLNCKKLKDVIRPADIDYWRVGCLSFGDYVRSHPKEYDNTNKLFCMTYLSTYQERSIYCISLNNNILSNVDFKTNTLFGFKIKIILRNPIWYTTFALEDDDMIDKFIKVIRKKFLGKRLLCYVVN